tara:strand:- start:129 stop:446 length:318 start_codon:yes stop_codon:yes gene_type:complete
MAPEELILRKIISKFKSDLDSSQDKNAGTFTWYWGEVSNWGIANIRIDSNGFEVHKLTDPALMLIFSVNEYQYSDFPFDKYAIKLDFNEDMGCLHIHWEEWPSTE